MKTNIKTLRGKHGAEVTLSTRQGHFFIKVRGRKPEPVIHRDHTGRIYGIERQPASRRSEDKALHTNGTEDALSQAGLVLKGLESLEPSSSSTIPEPETQDWLVNLSSSSSPASLRLPPNSLLVEGIDNLLGGN